TTIVDGNAQAFDHVLVNTELLARHAARVDAARIDADFAATRAADTTSPWRVSGRDPLRLVLATSPR
ncbi:MAG: hypothetical protein ACREO3_00235, partial [Arenimonas sp.]